MWKVGGVWYMYIKRPVEGDVKLVTENECGHNFGYCTPTTEQVIRNNMANTEIINIHLIVKMTGNLSSIILLILFFFIHVGRCTSQCSSQNVDSI